MSVGEHEITTAGGALIDVDAAEVDINFQHSPVTHRHMPYSFSVVNDQSINPFSPDFQDGDSD